MSATEWAVSASRADDPLSTPATPLAAAIVAFAATAIRTVFFVEEATGRSIPARGQ